MARKYDEWRATLHVVNGLLLRTGGGGRWHLTVQRWRTGSVPFYVNMPLLFAGNQLLSILRTHTGNSERGRLASRARRHVTSQIIPHILEKSAIGWGRQGFTISIFRWQYEGSSWFLHF